MQDAGRRHLLPSTPASPARSAGRRGHSKENQSRFWMQKWLLAVALGRSAAARGSVMSTMLNPRDIHAPVGPYSHTAVVPAGTELVFIAGQVGMRPDGSVPAAFAEQAELTFTNLRACLAAHGLGVEAVVKLSVFLLPQQDFQLLRGGARATLRRPSADVDDGVRAAIGEPAVSARDRGRCREGASSGFPRRRPVLP